MNRPWPDRRAGSLEALRDRFPEARRVPCTPKHPEYLQTQFKPLRAARLLVVLDGDGSCRSRDFFTDLQERSAGLAYDVVLVESAGASDAMPNSKVQSAGVCVRLQLPPSSSLASSMSAVCHWAARYGGKGFLACGTQRLWAWSNVEAALELLRNDFDALFITPPNSARWSAGASLRGMLGCSSPDVLFRVGFGRGLGGNTPDEDLIRILKARALGFEQMRVMGAQNSAFLSKPKGILNNLEDRMVGFRSRLSVMMQPPADDGRR